MIFGACAARVVLSIDDCVGGDGCRTDSTDANADFVFVIFLMFVLLYVCVHMVHHGLALCGPAHGYGRSARRYDQHAGCLAVHMTGNGRACVMVVAFGVI